MNERISIGLVDDHALFRSGIKSLLEAPPAFHVAFEADNGYSVPERLASQQELPNVMLIDLELPPDGNRTYSGLDLIVALRQRFPSIGLLMLSAHNDPYIIAQMIEAGAQGYLVKDCDPKELREAITLVHTTGSYINAQSLGAIQQRLRGPKTKRKTALPISNREEEVLKLVCQQLTAAEIGERLYISVKTVNGHRNNLLQKTGSRNVTGLVMYAIKHGIVELV